MQTCAAIPRHPARPRPLNRLTAPTAGLFLILFFNVAPCLWFAPAPPSRTQWTRLVYPSVLNGHVTSLHQY